MTEIRITVLVDNTVRKSKLIAEHGLSFLLETGEAKILFDTGQGIALPHNTAAWDLRLDDIDAVVLSHGHYDHTGGLAYVLERAKRASVYLHPAAMHAKYGRRQGEAIRRIGIGEEQELALRERADKTVWTEGPTRVAPDVWVTGEIPRRTSFEDTGGGFYLDKTCETPDPLRDDQALYVDTPSGLVVLLGCTHSGVVNTLDYIAALSHQERIHAVLGGTHLIAASEERLKQTAGCLKRYNVEVLAAGHCTGAKATAFLRAEFPTQSAELSVGAAFRF